MARNDKHREGLYKLGYCVQPPEGRVASLETQHREASDVGHFSLVHSVPVTASYYAEQALFDVLAGVRPVAKREFFFQSEGFLIRSLDAAHAFSFGNDDALTDFYDWSLGQELWAMPSRSEHVPVRPASTPNGGWIYATRVMWHQENLFRVSYSRKDPRQKLVALDAAQRKFTSQIGFHTLALCVSVDDLQPVWGALAPRLAPMKVSGSKVYFDLPLSELTQLISEACAVRQQPSAPFANVGAGEISVQKVSGRMDLSWAAWAVPCLSCGVMLRFTGAIGARALVACPGCRSSLVCAVRASGAVLAWE